MRFPLTVLLLVVGSFLPAACGGSGGGTTAPKADVLVIHAGQAGYAADVSTKLDAFGTLGTVQTFDASLATPDLATLRMYDAVLVMSDDVFADEDALGDVLADYIDDGGGVVLSMFTMGNFADGRPAGRFLTGGYGLIGPSTSNSLGVVGDILVVDGASPVLTNVTSFGGSTASYAPVGATLLPGANLVATWDDAARTPLIATRVIGRTPRVDLGFYPPTQDTGRADFIDPATDSMLVVANALRWVSGGF